MTSRTQPDGGVDALFKYQRDQQVPQTPEEIKQFRNSYRKQLGHSCLHPKLRLDQNSLNLPKVYGKPQPYSDHCSDLFPKDKFTGVDSIVNEVREQVYASNYSMPLGKTMDRRYVFPNQVSQQNFRYGAVTKKDEKDAKEVMYYQSERPKGNESEVSTQKTFFKPICQLEVGEQINRRYNPQVFNPDRKFGVSSVLKPDDMKVIFKGEDSYANSKLVDRRQELYQNAKHHHLGLPKSSFILQDNARRNFMSTSTPNLNIQKLGVKDCLFYKDLAIADAQQSDLGRSVVLGVKNLPRSIDQNKIFGVPSIRTDVSPPHYVSLTNTNNYGFEANASKLLNPFQYSSLGLSEEDFSKLRSRDEIRNLIESIGYKYKTGKFFGIFQRAQEIQGDFDGKVSLSSFLSAMQELNQIS